MKKRTLQKWRITGGICVDEFEMILESELKYITITDAESAIYEMITCVINCAELEYIDIRTIECLGSEKYVKRKHFPPYRRRKKRIISRY